MTNEPRSDTPAGTPEGYTKEEPGVDEIGQPGTPGAGKTAALPHAADAELVEAGHAPADPAIDTQDHDAATHMDSHAALSDDDHGHAGTVLGPIDWTAWAYAIVGAVGGLIVLAVFYLAVSRGSL